uniref:CN hydrolase domain-containing protein n=1 Tax=Parastrongyloides trichosuri TaxID=131310 RepID=A0A0N4Z9Z0_PARTI
MDDNSPRYIDDVDSEISIEEEILKEKISKIALVQCGSVIFNIKETMEKVETYTEEASKNGCDMIIFPEAFIGGHPKGLSFDFNYSINDNRNEFKKYFDSSIEYGSYECNILKNIALKYNILLIIGVVERDGCTLYSSMFFYSPSSGRIGRSRKLMPATYEKIVWSRGDGSDVNVFDTKIGKIGCVLSWDSYMPLMRCAMYHKGVEIYLTPTVDDSETWINLIKTIAIEGRCYVLSVSQYLTTSNFPENHITRENKEKKLIRGGSCVINPLGEVLLSPSYDKETIFYVSIDLNDIVKGKFDLDTTGHFSRPDIFKLIVNENKINGYLKE